MTDKAPTTETAPTTKFYDWEGTPCRIRPDRAVPERQREDGTWVTITEGARFYKEATLERPLSPEELRTIPLCADCIDCMPQGGIDFAWRRLEPGEQCMADDHEENQPEPPPKRTASEAIEAIHELVGDSMDGFDPQAFMDEMRGPRLRPLAPAALELLAPAWSHARVYTHSQTWRAVNVEVVLEFVEIAPLTEAELTYAKWLRQERLAVLGVPK